VRPRLVALVASLAGAGVSIYLTAVHYSGSAPACPANPVVNCEQVLSSGYAVVAGSGVPTSAAGILWFAVSAVIAGMLLAGRSWARAQLAWSAIGLATVVYLLFVEIVQLGVICLWCTLAHVLVLTIFLVAITSAAPPHADSR
jgi:uncharacterized membrane protein